MAGQLESPVAEEINKRKEQSLVTSVYTMYDALRYLSNV